VIGSFDPGGSPKPDGKNPSVALHASDNASKEET
jgi:hypothetical protein